MYRRGYGVRLCVLTLLPLQVITGCMDILHQSTFEMRHEKHDVRDDPETQRRLFGRAALDPEVEEEDGGELGGTSS